MRSRQISITGRARARARLEQWARKVFRTKRRRSPRRPPPPDTRKDLSSSIITHNGLSPLARKVRQASRLAAKVELLCKGIGAEWSALLCFGEKGCGVGNATKGWEERNLYYLFYWGISFVRCISDCGSEFLFDSS